MLIDEKKMYFTIKVIVIPEKKMLKVILKNHQTRKANYILEVMTRKMLKHMEQLQKLRELVRKKVILLRPKSIDLNCETEGCEAI